MCNTRNNQNLILTRRQKEERFFLSDNPRTIHSLKAAIRAFNLWLKRYVRFRNILQTIGDSSVEWARFFRKFCIMFRNLFPSEKKGDSAS